MEKLEGKWKFSSSENFDDYLKALGFGLLKRKAGQAIKPNVSIIIEGKKVTVANVSRFVNSSVTATLDEELDETTPDGRKVKGLFFVEGKKLVHTHKWEDKETKITRYLDEEGRMITELSIGDVLCRRVFVRVKN